ncbi:MAG: hypothetical protein DRQ44_07070 [Gammaproteobacteria bacterium]|nr:MAG: hypothetical protein DRQ44_07070 [Gammaproteobacteria bacterium]
MNIFKHLRSDWFRYGFETLAVIVGILIAFALESWADTQKVRKEEHEILVNLHNDLQDAKQQSIASIDTELKSKDNLLLALNQNSNADTLPRGFYSDSIFYELIWNLEMEVPVIYSYSDIKTTGKTGLITNEQIRRRFTNLEMSVTNLSNQVDDRLRVQQLRIDEVLVNDLNFVRMVSTVIPEIGNDNEPENNYQLFLKNQKIRNIIAVKLTLTHEVISYRKALDAEIESLIAMLDEEIEDF